MSHRPAGNWFRPPLIAMAHVARATRTLMRGALMLKVAMWSAQQVKALQIAITVLAKSTGDALSSIHVTPISCQYTMVTPFMMPTVHVAVSAPTDPNSSMGHAVKLVTWRCSCQNVRSV